MGRVEVLNSVETVCTDIYGIPSLDFESLWSCLLLLLCDVDSDLYQTPTPICRTVVIIVRALAEGSCCKVGNVSLVEAIHIGEGRSGAELASQ